MATQNFVAGGFYGKLGDIVGQRWRNKRIMRRHVIPLNPQTTAQQANRALFASAVRLSQQALNINPGAPAWFNEAIGEFSLRTGVAKLRLRDGLSEAQAVPIFPDDYIPYHTFESATIQSMEANGRAKWALSPVPPVSDRILSGCFYCRNLLTGEWENIYSTATLPSTTPLIFDPNIPAKYGFPTGAWLEGATLNDELFSNNAYFLPRLSTTEPEPVTRFYEGDFVDFIDGADYVRVIYESFFEPFDIVDPIVSGAWCQKNGIWGQYDDIGQITYQGNGIWYKTCTKVGGYSFPSGSYIDGVETEVSKPYYVQYIVLPGYEIA